MQAVGCPPPLFNQPESKKLMERCVRMDTIPLDAQSALDLRGKQDEVYKRLLGHSVYDKDERANIEVAWSMKAQFRKLLYPPGKAFNPDWFKV